MEWNLPDSTSLNKQIEAFGTICSEARNMSGGNGFLVKDLEGQWVKEKAEWV